MKILFYILFGLCLVQCAQTNTQVTQPKLSVAYVVNPRLPQLSEQEIENILLEIQKITRQSFNLALTFKPVDVLDISDFFSSYSNAIILDTKFKEHHLPIDTSSKEKLYQNFIQPFSSMSTEEIKAAIRNQSNADEINLSTSRNELIKQVAYLHINKLLTIQSIIALDGKDLIQNDLYNEFMAWDYIIERTSAYDIIFTNQIIASAESYLPDIHASMRGGITNGAAIKSKGAYGGTIVMTTYPFIDTTDYFTNARGQNYSIRTITESIAYLTLHEIGHLFKYRYHEYNHKGCVMRPTPGLHYKEWVEELKKNGPCQLPHKELQFYKDYYSK